MMNYSDINVKKHIKVLFLNFSVAVDFLPRIISKMLLIKQNTANLQYRQQP